MTLWWARPERPVKAEVIPHQRPLPTPVLPDLPRGATGANGHGGDDPGPGDEGQEELVAVPR